MKSEQLVWVIQGVDYLETVVRRERQGTSHGVSIRVAKGLYYSPRQFRSRPIEWEETVQADTGTLGLTTKHIYFAGSRKKFRVRYDRIVSFEPIRRRLRRHARCPDRQAPDVPHRRRLVRLQPGCQPGPDAELNPLRPSSPHTAHQRQPTSANPRFPIWDGPPVETTVPGKPPPNPNHRPHRPGP